jgi:putative ATP-binding cassette transporter
MILFNFFRHEVKVDYKPLLFFLLCSGLANASLLIFINLRAEHTFNDTIKLGLLVAYVVALLVYVFAQRYTLDTAITAVESALATLKIRLFNKIRHQDLSFIEQHAQVSDFAPLVKDSNLLAQGTTQFILAIQNSIVLTIAFAYLAFLSMTTFLLLIFLLVIALPFYRANVKKSQHFLKKSSRKESFFLRHLQAMLKGLKLLKLDHAEAIGLSANSQAANQQASTARLSFNTYMVENILFSNALFYIFLLVVVFFLPIFIPEHQSLLYQIISTLLFIMVPLLMLVVVVPMLARTTQNLQSLYTLEKKLDQAAKSVSGTLDESFTFSKFSSIQLADIVFQYTNHQREAFFTLGPFDFVLHRSEVVFITGQNGSGKSTFLKLLSGLYAPHRGKLFVDDLLVEDAQREPYQQLFAMVFADFHLFDQVYGVSEEQAAEVAFWLREMWLDSITCFDGRRFSHTRLSTGLRKRLAFVVAMIKKRPICLFDELAADQDPAFRRHFYEHVLPLVKQRGHSVVLVSHDLQYQHCADRVVRFEQGQIVVDN